MTEPTARTAPPPEACASALGGLLSPPDVAALLEEALGRDALHAHAGADAARRLFGWPQLNAALAEHRLSPPRLRLEQSGADATRGLFATRRTRRGELLHDLDAAVLNARLRDGATLILDAANELSPPLQALCAGLAAEFACACQANLYACWGTTQGFDVHWDDHDVLVVQVEGRKRWALYGMTRAAPLRREAATAGAPTEPLSERVLEPGDVLYLPRGYWHAAVGLGEPTLHLTIGLTRKTGADLLHWLADELLTESAVRADLAFERGGDALERQVGQLLALAARQDPQDLARRYRRHVERHQTHRPQLSFPLIGDGGPAAADRLRLADGAVRLSAAGDGLVLSWRGIEFTVSPRLEPALSVLAAGRALAVREIESLVPPQARDGLPAFLREMIQRGVLVVAPEPAA